MPSGLDEQARSFADECSALLNATITNGVRVSAVTLPGGSSQMGVGISRKNLKPAVIPLAANAASARVWLFLTHSYSLDDEGVWLTMTRSTYAVYTSAEMTDDTLILSADYTRDPVNQYPGAHLHVGGQRDDLTDICKNAASTSTKLRDLHLPVGGKRFRPSLEDVIEFVILEGMADGRPGWDAAVAAGRARWEERQLKAMVRRSPEVAAEQLAAAGWAVTPPAP